MFDSIEELIDSHGNEIRSRDSVMIPWIIEENRARIFHCFIMSPSWAGFTAGIQGTLRHKSTCGMISSMHYKTELDLRI